MLLHFYLLSYSNTFDAVHSKLTKFCHHKSQSPPDSQQLETCSLSATSLAMLSSTNRFLNVPVWSYPAFPDVFY